MNLATLGATIDIHTGGEDNIFPHHEAEIAQSECGNAAPLARCWLHTRHLLVDGMKMSKSTGNFYRLEDVLERGYSAMDLRLLYISSHYRSQMNFTWEALAQAKANRESLMQAYERLKTLKEDEGVKTIDTPYHQFLDAIQDDLNTPLALAGARNVASFINVMADKNYAVHPSTKVQYEKMIFTYFGLKEEVSEIPRTIIKLLEERRIARENKDFARSDTLRDEISRLGWIVEDSTNGQTVRKK
jgi:cysteinyl-tRNA synthetase